MSGVFNAITKPFKSLLGMDAAKAAERQAKLQREQYEQELLMQKNQAAIKNQNAEGDVATVTSGGSAAAADADVIAAKKRKTAASISQSLGI